MAYIFLSEEHARFLMEDHSIVAASSGGERVPSMARVLACRVSADRRSVLLLFHPQQAMELLDDVRQSARIAATFTEPPTHRTLQIKGGDAQVIETPADAEDLAEAHVRGFAALVAPLGHEEPLTRALLRGLPGPLAAVRFTPEAAFQQTPGPRAGEPLP